MLILFDNSENRILAFTNYSKLHSHLVHFERTKGKGRWVFARHSHQRVLSFYRYVHAQKLLVQLTTSGTFEQGLEQALLKGGTKETTGKIEGGKNYDILEIVSGNARKPLFIPVTPDVDVHALEQKWCKIYCKIHGFPLFEVSSPADFKGTGGGHD